MRILLVDDEQELVSTLAERLSMRGIDADWACSGEEALEKAGRQNYDLAVLDVKMPRISGLEVKAEMEMIQPELRYIFMTGHGSANDFYSGSSDAKTVGYLIKPVNIDILIGKIKEALSG
ncbi:MAG: response regulator [Desulfobulbaceae bacterium]|uniref:Response regulator n=1 Tax=Candidatus Desulfatifera sulfidica TaxID=2841691 RepID=A0A8J6NBQ3_9BACT|nr:response regulator [Candidatus Desulfatifera sulfidica]